MDNGANDVVYPVLENVLLLEFNGWENFNLNTIENKQVFK